MMLVHSGRRMGSDAFDQVIGLDQVESPETRRSRRSRFIQLVNAEAQARFGRDLVVRVRSKEDKRVISTMSSDWMRKMIDKGGVYLRLHVPVSYTHLTLPTT